MGKMHCDDHFSISVFFFPLAVDSSALSMQCLCCESLRKKETKNTIFIYYQKGMKFYTKLCCSCTHSSYFSFPVYFCSSSAAFCSQDVLSRHCHSEEGEKMKRGDAHCSLLVIWFSQCAVHDLFMPAWIRDVSSRDKINSHLL